MSQSRIQSTVVRMVASQLKLKAEEVRLHVSLRDQLGLRSLEMLVLRENIERAFGIVIEDEDVAEFRTVSSIIQLVSSRVEPAAPEPAPVPVFRRVGPPGSELRSDGMLQTDIEISMQLLGQNGLAETPFLMRVADLRWQHMGAIAGMLTRDIVDAEGDRLYAAVFFVEVCFPAAKPMGSFRENDRISIVSTLGRFGTTYLDGYHYVFAEDAPAAAKKAPPTLQRAAALQVPWIRISNSFVKKWDGAAWLKKSRPAADNFTRIRELESPPSSHEEVLAVRDGRRFFDVPETYLPLTPEPVELPYDIVPDRDMNGAGLVYFAVYPAIMDVAERRVLSTAGALSFDEDLLDKRTLVRRKTAYFGNARATDRILTTLHVFVENPFRAKFVDPETAPIRLIEELRLRRASDGRLMAISSAQKVVLGRVLGETSLFDALRRLT